MSLDEVVRDVKNGVTDKELLKTAIQTNYVYVGNMITLKHETVELYKCKECDKNIGKQSLVRHYLQYHSGGMKVYEK